MKYIATAVILLSLLLDCLDAKRYLPDWESLDTRPLPQWFDDAKFGIFIVWGVYSVPSYGNEWFWHNWKGGDPAVVKFMKENYPPNFTYGDFAASFGAELFNPDQWADILKASGARYIETVTITCIGYFYFILRWYGGMQLVEQQPCDREVALLQSKLWHNIHIYIPFVTKNFQEG